MAPKAPARSALYFFADEYRRRTDRRLGIREAIELCYPQWKALSEEEKEKYTEMYKRYKQELKEGKISGPGGTDGRRLNCLGRPIQETRDRLEELLARKNAEMDYLQRRLNIPLDQLARTEFLIMSHQIFCKTSEGYVLPAEVSICRWSISGHIRDTLTTVMRPKQIPDGYGSDAAMAERIHAIPSYGDEAKMINDYAYAFNALNRFIELRPRDELYLDSLLFLKEENVDEGLKALERLAFESLNPQRRFVIGVPKRPMIGLMSCESLFSVLWKASCRQAAETEPSTADVRQIISSDLYAYDRGVSCDYHEALENVNCAQNHLKHICFGMEKHICPRFACSDQKFPGSDGPDDY